MVFSPMAGRAADLTVASKIEGVEKEKLRKELRGLSRFSADSEPYSAMVAIRRGANADAAAMVRALTSKGYYAGKVTPDLVRIGGDVTVNFQVTLGSLFKIVDYRIEYQNTSDGERPETFQDIGVTAKGDPKGDTLKTLENKLLTHLWERGYPAAQTPGRYVKADFENATAIAVFPIDSGPLSRYGDIRVVGAEKTDQDRIKDFANFKEGALYKRSDIDAFQDELSNTGLYQEVTITPAAPEENSRTDIIVTVKERKHRTVGIGLSFATDVGPGATAYWENRNLLGYGEKLRAEVSYAAPRQTAGLTLSQALPKFRGAWKASTAFENEDTDAFSAQTYSIGVGVERYWWDKDLQLSADLNYQFSDITDSDGTEESFSLVSLPLAALYNTENDSLNPTSGHRLRGVITPFFGDTQFNKLELGGATRIGFGEDKSTLFALRALFGATFGAEGFDLPATERFFAGGGGSIRGYGFQLAGPLDANGDPTGGASIAEVNFEARQRITKKWQVAAFVDAGSVYQSETPDFSGDTLTGVGVGVRYFTPIGPVRFDVAVPLNKREIFQTPAATADNPMPEPEVVFEDDAFHLYIALGQPF